MEGSQRYRRFIPGLVWVLVGLTLVLIPLKVIEQGYLPQDDALRHAAKAISGKAWSEILVLREEVTIDQHAGWHAFLAQLHRRAGLDGEELVGGSAVLLFWVFTFSALPWLRRPEAWIATLLVLDLATVNLAFRLHLGRPLLVTMAVLVAILFLWSRIDRPAPSVRMLVLTILLVTVAAWTHGSWYLFVLPIAAFGLAREWGKLVRLGLCIVAGVAAGATLTGRPVAYLVEQVHHMRLSLGPNAVPRFLVSEFQPSDGVFWVVVVVVLVVLARKAGGTWSASSLDEPVFWLAVLGWVLGFKVYRFWSDWGMPATMIWIALQIQRIWEERVAPDAGPRLAATALVCLALFLSVTGDLRGRWTTGMSAEYLSADDPELDGWLPDDGGILYNSGMRDFYGTFFANPHGRWRYILGFEPTLMPPEELTIYRDIQWNRYDLRAFAPWIAKMRPEDRLLIHRGGGIVPALSELEWRYVASDTWLGRLPRERGS